MFTLLTGNYAFVSQHIGDMENAETLEAYERTIALPGSDSKALLTRAQILLPDDVPDQAHRDDVRGLTVARQHLAYHGALQARRAGTKDDVPGRVAHAASLP